MKQRSLDLSLCMIVKDAESELPRCLDSVVGVVDEMIIVDTGSTDRTVEVARSYGAQVFEIAWNDDFSAARNVSLDRARGRWVLVLDADEFFEPGCSQGIRDLLQDERYLGYYMPCRSPLGNSDSLEVSLLRLFRASPKVRFRYPIHEQVLEDLQAWSEKTGQRFGHIEDVVLHHDGYLPEVAKRKRKTERNLRLFRKAVADYPDSLYLWFKYAEALRPIPGDSHLHHTAIQRAYELSRALNGEERRRAPHLADVFAHYAAHLLETDQLEKAESVIDEEPPGSFRSPTYDYVAALVLEARGRVREALRCARDCQGPDRHSFLVVASSKLRSIQAPLLEARLHLQLGDGKVARGVAHSISQRHPQTVACWRIMADACLVVGDVGGALHDLAEGLRANPEHPELLSQTGLVLLRVRRMELALSFLERAGTSERIGQIALEVLRPAQRVLDPQEHEEVRVLQEVVRGSRRHDLPTSPAVRVLAPIFGSLFLPKAGEVSAPG